VTEFDWAVQRAVLRNLERKLEDGNVPGAIEALREYQSAYSETRSFRESTSRMQMTLTK